MPNVKKGESKQKFIKRCIPMVVDEGTAEDGSQAYAICNSIYDRSSAGKAGLGDEDFGLETFESDVKLETFEEGNGDSKIRKFISTAYAGQIVDRWFGKAIVDVASLKAKKNSIPVLRGHDSDKIAGHSTKVWKDESNFFVEGEVSNSTEHGREIISLADEGFPWQISIGIAEIRREVLEDETQEAEVNGMKVKGPIEIWRDATVHEISFLPFGADNKTAGIVMSDDELRAEIKKVITKKDKGENLMKKELIEKLMKDERYSFTEEDQASLEALSETALQKMLEVPKVEEKEDETLAEKDAQIQNLTATVNELKDSLKSTSNVLNQEIDARMTAEIKAELNDNAVPGDFEKNVAMLLKLRKSDEAMYTEVFESLKAAGVAVKAAGTFKEAGTQTDEASTFTKASEVYNKLQDLKKVAMEADSNLKEHEAWRKVTRENRSLYKEYNDLREKETKNVRDDDTED